MPGPGRSVIFPGPRTGRRRRGRSRRPWQRSCPPSAVAAACRHHHRRRRCRGRPSWATAARVPTMLRGRALLVVAVGVFADLHATLDRDLGALVHVVFDHVDQRAPDDAVVPRRPLLALAVLVLPAFGGGDAERRHLAATRRRSDLGIAPDIADQKHDIHRLSPIRRLRNCGHRAAGRGGPWRARKLCRPERRAWCPSASWPPAFRGPRSPARPLRPRPCGSHW